MRRIQLQEKNHSSSYGSEKTQKAAHAMIIACQHCLLWCSMSILCATTYILSEGGLAIDVLVSESFLLANCTMSMAYLALHNGAALCRKSNRKDTDNRRQGIIQKMAMHLLRFSITAWLLTCAVAITFTMARRPHCTQTETTASTLDFGSTCIVQRITVAASLVALVFSGALFILMHRAREPFTCHLLGKAREQPLLPLVLPYKTSLDRPNPTFSEMSFKCRSSKSLSSRTLVPSSYTESTTSLLLKQPEKAVGLEIYSPRSVKPSFLGPRPSLASISSHASIHVPPPTSPLPPLPAYFPEKYGRGSAMYKAIYPPKRPQRPSRRRSERTVRMVPPSPALSVANLAAFNRSAESLSSVYSRSISGERHESRIQQRLGTLAADSRSFSSSSTATIIKSPLGAMRLASDPDVVVGSRRDRRHSSSADSESDIDDAATLQARLPSVKAVSDFGEVSGWPGERDVACNYYHKSYQICIGEMRGVDFTPLNVRRTRDSVSMVNSGAFRAAA